MWVMLAKVIALFVTNFPFIIKYDDIHYCIDQRFSDENIHIQTYIITCIMHSSCTWILQHIF